MSWVSPGIRYFSAMSSTCLLDVLPQLRASPACARRRSWRRAARSPLRAGTWRRSPAARCPAGRCTQSGAVAVRQRELEFVGALRQPVGDDRFHAALAEGAARCLLAKHASAARSPGVARSVMFFCALSITASRSCSCCRWSVVFLVVVFIDSPRFCVTASSRWLHGLLQLRPAGRPASRPCRSRRALSSAQPLLAPPDRPTRRRAGAAAATRMATTPAAIDQAEDEQAGFPIMRRASQRRFRRSARCERRANGRAIVAGMRSRRQRRALTAFGSDPLHRAPWRCATSSSSPTSGCGWSPSR